MEGEVGGGGSRVLGGTEQSWSRAVPGGTGIAVLAILTSHSPNSTTLQTALHKLQINHPILRSRLHHSSSSPATIVTAAKPFVTVTELNLLQTLNILESNNNITSTTPTLQLILEHELNNNLWTSSSSSSTSSEDMLFATTYALPKEKWVMVLRLHVAACDRTTAVSLLKELLTLVGSKEEKKWPWAEGNGEVELGIEKLIPGGKNKKSMWSRGLNMVSYSLGSFRLTNLKFVDAKSPRRSQVVRLQLDHHQTRKLLDGCEKAEIKLCGALTAAGMIAAAQMMRKNINYNGGVDVTKQRKFGIVTLTDCRPILQPSLSPHHFGFYHSAIMNTHVLKVKGGSSSSHSTTSYNLWEVAQKAYLAFKSYKDNHRQFTDMADINFLMTTALDNPSLTPSSALRTSLMSVFEDTVVDNSSSSSEGADVREAVGLLDYMGCASVHGIGPSIAVFDTLREGKLDCVCVYPSPLHSREQMEEFVEKMKTVLISG
ncbi:hypothetical protein LINPERPRIM_LOCUS25713 [Linum perenne]